MKPIRECLPSKEREDYVAYVRRQGVTFVTERQTNRYVDEFLRFCLARSKHSSAVDISSKDILQYAKHLERTCMTFVTARVKMSIVLQWSRWLHETGRIKENPADNLKARSLLASMESREKPQILR